jgi:hypothetical protein
MYRKIALAGATAAAIIGVGATALAASGTTSGAGTGSSPTHHGHRHALRALLRHVQHAEVTTKGKDGFVTHSAVRGAVSSVSPTSITVKAADGYMKTFTINGTTKVRERTAGQRGGTAGKIADVKSGDEVAVMGKAPEGSTAAPVARVVIDGVPK